MALQMETPSTIHRTLVRAASSFQVWQNITFIVMILIIVEINLAAALWSSRGGFCATLGATLSVTGGLLGTSFPPPPPPPHGRAR